MIIYYDERITQLEFGINKLKKVLDREDIIYAVHNILSYSNDTKESNLVVRFLPSDSRYLYSDLEVKNNLVEESFELVKKDNTWFLNGGDATGAMYGLIQLSEIIEENGIVGIKETYQKPYHKMRGIKFNLPFEPYDIGDPFEKNINTVLSQEYWNEFLESLAEQHYNCLSLWSENPFPMMFRLSKYPDTCPYDEATLSTYKNLYKFIFKRGLQLGIKTYLITWNIRLTPYIAKGLGLQEEIGDMHNRYNVIRDNSISLYNPASVLDKVRQNDERIKDYFKECIHTLLATYEDLSGFGTTASEEMYGSTEERVQWVCDTYLEGAKASGRIVPFIFRTNLTASKVIQDKFIKNYPGETILSWKYSIAHMYSSIEPKFEEEWKAWEGFTGNNPIVYTVRNDDFHTFAGGSKEFLKQYIIKMKRERVEGFYWGADGYIWGNDFQFVPHREKTWKYDFERHWYEFMLLGRLSYDPQTPEYVWSLAFKNHYVKIAAPFIQQSFEAAGNIIPCIQRIFWNNFDYEWHPESLLSSYGIKTVLDFMNGNPMPGVGTCSIRESVKNKKLHHVTPMEDVYDILQIIDKSTITLLTSIKQAYECIGQHYLYGMTLSVLKDMEAWYHLGKYYYNKIQAAVCLCEWEIDRDQKWCNQAIEYLEAGVKEWKELTLCWAEQYIPYKMVRSKYYFGYGYYLSDVQRDIELARNYCK